MTPETIIAAVEKGLQDMFAGGVVVDVTNEGSTDDYLAKADAATDPVLAAGYRKLARKAAKKARKAGSNRHEL